LPTLSEIPEYFLTAVCVALGLAFGSFLNVVIYRLPRDESVIRPASRCPGCGKAIRGYDNIPVFGWLLLRGRARCCGIKISPRYPLVELCGGLLAWAIVQANILTLEGDTPIWQAALLFALYLALGLGLIAATFIDLEHMYLPDEITLGGTVLGLISIPVRPGAELIPSLIGAAVGFGVIWLLFDVMYRKLRGHAGMGLGDAKLLMLAGAWFGLGGAAFTLFGGAVQASCVALVVMLVRGKIEEPEAVIKEREEFRRALEAAEGKEREELEREQALDILANEPEPGFGKARIAFGPFLAIALLEYMLFGDSLIREFFSLGLPPQ
jgi:leader peptidase (prepilin peptidase)/N-methyltransferase